MPLIPAKDTTLAVVKTVHELTLFKFCSAGKFSVRFPPKLKILT